MQDGVLKCTGDLNIDLLMAPKSSYDDRTSKTSMRPPGAIIVRINPYLTFRTLKVDVRFT